MKRRRIATTTTNAFGLGGYLFCCLQWLWTVALILPWFLKTGFMQSFLVPPTVAAPVAIPSGELSIGGLIFIAIVVVVMVGLTIYVCLKLPAAIGRTGRRLTHQVTELALPVVSGHKPLAKKRRLQLSARLLLSAKLILCLLPLGAVWLIDNPDIELSRNVVIIIGVFTAWGSISLFGLQALMAKLLHVDSRQLW